MKAEGGEDKSDPERKAAASVIAKEAVGVDPSILSLLVLDSRGQVLAVERSNRLPESHQIGKDITLKLGVIAEVIWGAANSATSPFLGPMDFMIGGFKNERILFINLQGRDMLLALRMTRSSNSEDVCNKILKTLDSKIRET
jgi:hypothetical protein